MPETIDKGPAERVLRLRRAACEVALQLGPEGRASFVDRLRQRDSTVTAAEAAELESWTRQVTSEARELAEDVRRHSRRDEIPSHTAAWQAGIEELLQRNSGLDRDQANRLLGLGMARTAF